MLLQQRVSEGPSRTSSNFQMEKEEMKEDVMIVMIPPSSDSKVNYCIATNDDNRLVYVRVCWIEETLV